MYGPLYHGHRFTDKIETIRVGEPHNAKGHRAVHYEIHQALNLTKMSCVLATMAEQGTPKETIEQFKALHAALVGLMTTENNRNHGY